MFKHLRTKLTTLYASLFVLVLGFVAVIVYTVVNQNAEDSVRKELVASGTVFDRILSLRSQQLQDGADILSRDFGFREAVATEDEATMISALENLKSRVNADRAFILTTDGTLLGANAGRFKSLEEELFSALVSDNYASGALVIEQAPYQAISAPILAPNLIGWIVFATKLDEAEMSSLESLAAIPLEASVLYRASNGAWRTGGVPNNRKHIESLRPFIDQTVAQDSSTPVRTPSGNSMVVVKQLQRLSDDRPLVLMIRYPLALAMAPYNTLLALIALTGLVGVVVVVAGSWLLSRTLTRPIAALDKAARSISIGEQEDVLLETPDEIGRLSNSFNIMAAGIRAREKQITHQARHDLETGLPNRLSFQNDITTYEKRCEQHGLYVAAFGIDRFREVRNAIGHELMGVLVGAIGKRLSKLYAPSPTYRFSTDSVGVVVESKSEEELIQLVSRFRDELEQTVDVGKHTVDVGITVGLANIATDNDIVHKPVDRTSIAIDQARATHRNVAVFDEALYGNPSSNLSLMGDMIRAIGTEELFIHHQPKYNIKTGKISGIEVLARWKHATRGMIRPDIFVEMAEETGHIQTLTEWVLKQAIRDQVALRDAGYDLLVSVNVSGRLMSDLDFADWMIQQITGANANICLEITETAVIENPEQALEVINKFLEAEIEISIDDYGAGLSSLSYLKQIHAKELKIDREFVSSLDTSPRDKLLVKSTIDLAHSLGMKVTAEGIETTATLVTLQGMGCDLAQGYLIARPMPFDEVQTFLDQFSENNTDLLKPAATSDAVAS